MYINNTKTILFLCLFGMLFSLQAQQWLGRTTGNYSGTYGIYNNASSISDSKYKYYFNFWGRGVNFYNNYLSYNAPIKLNQWANNSLNLNQYKDFDGKIRIGDDWFNENLDGKVKQFSFNQDIWGPAMMFPVSKNWNMSINTRQRSGLQMHGITEEAAVMANNGISNNQFASIDRKFSINMQTYQELSFTLGGILTRNENHLLSGGATVKFIRGLGAAYLTGTQLNIQGTGNNSALINGDFEYAYTDDKSAIAPFNDPYGLFSLQSRGGGIGMDLGITYTYRSEKLRYKSKWQCNRNDLRSDYDLKLSMAFNDIGGVKYNNRSNTYSYSSQANTSVNVSSDILNGFGIATQNGFDSIGKNVFAQMGATRSSGFNTSLPAAFNFQADFRFSRSFYTAIYLNQSLKGTKTNGLRSTSMLSIIPRFESRTFEFSMPLTLGENYKNFYVGAYARIGPVFFGSDNLGGLVNVAAGTEFRGADIYGGVSIGIGHCLTWRYKDVVDPVYVDSSRIDSVKTEFRDTLNTIEKDTIILKDTVKIIKRDTVYIDKTNKSKAEIERENELKRRELELNKRKTELDAREKEILSRQKEPVTDNVALKNCNDKNTELQKENLSLRDKITTQQTEILRLQRQVEELNRKIPVYELEKQKCNDDKIKTNAEIIRLQEEILKANRKINELENEVTILKKANQSKNPTEIPSGTDAQKLAKANKQIDSLKLVILYLQSDVELCKKNALTDKNKAENDVRIAKRQNDSLNNLLKLKIAELEECKKNITLNSNEILKKAEADKAKAENDARIAKKQVDSLNVLLKQKIAENEECKKNTTLSSNEILKKAESDKAKAENNARIAKKQADSLVYILSQRNIELENCKKNSTLSSNEALKKAEADKAKAENDVKIANKRADSLSNILSQRNIELENCKKNSTSNNVDLQKMKKCEDDNALLKSEMQEMSKTIGRLNTKNYALTLRVDSLINELKNCCKNCENSGSNNDAELLKKCQESKAELENEISRLKTVISKKDKSLDSMEAIATSLKNKQTELNVTISTLNKEISDLKEKGTTANCDELQKQLDDKNAELNKVKSENTALQNQVKTISNQLNEYKTEYQFMVKQNQICKNKLDSCVKGLNAVEPKDEGSIHPRINEGSEEGNSNNSDDSSSASVSDEKRKGEGLRVGAKILGLIIDAALESQTNQNSSSGSSTGSSSNGTTRPTEKGSGTGSTGTTGSSGSTKRPSETSSGSTDTSSGDKKPTEKNSGSTGTGSNTSGNSGSDRSGGAVDGSTRRR